MLTTIRSYIQQLFFTFLKSRLACIDMLLINFFLCQVFLVLNLTKEAQNHRLLARHGSDEAGKVLADSMRKVFNFYEPAGNDEENAFNIDISEEMSVDDVMNKILEVLNSIK